MEEVVDANSDDIYNWPWTYMEDAGGWQISAAQGAGCENISLAADS